MANIKYFAECNGAAVELQCVYHDRLPTGRYGFIGTCPACNQKHVADRTIEYKQRPSLHECNDKCLSGSVNGRCECRCGGKNHGRSRLPMAA